jgi:predicted metal-binding membrane protein
MVADSAGATEPSDVARRPDLATVLALGALLLVTTVAWWQTVASPMGADDMAGMGMTMMPTVAGAASYVAAWGVMMTAMMLPSALPIITLYAVTQRGTGGPVARTVRVASFAAVYLGIWALSGLPIYFGSFPLMAAGPATLAYAAAAVLVVAGLFQLSPLKQVCLRHCRSPIGFVLGHWRAGWLGALRMGGAHALYCLGCCWALMIVLVVAGAMGLAWVLLIACVVAAEKLLPRGEWIARAAGLALVVLGIVVAIRPGFATSLRAGPFM